MSLSITAKVRIRYGDGVMGSEEIRSLLDDGYVIVDCSPWVEGPNWGGESPGRVGFTVSLEKR